MSEIQTNLAGLPHFVGSRPYIQIATHGDAVLGVHLAYHYDPETTVSSLLAFFASHGKDGKDFVHFHPREKSAYVVLDAEGNVVGPAEGVRLNKTVIPLFKGVEVHPLFAKEYAEKFGVFPKLGAWLTQQIDAEGFTSMFLDATQFFRDTFPGSVAPPDPEKVQEALDLPDLESPDSWDMTAKSNPEQELDTEDEDDIYSWEESEDHDEESADL